MSESAAAAPAPSSSSSWANRLEAKLASLTETSSKESIQTLAKWMGFNRKHATAFAQVLQARLLLHQHQDSGIIIMTEKLQVTYINVIHEVMLLEQHNTAKWDKLSELRCALGQDVVLHLAKQHNAWSEMAKEKLLATTTTSGAASGAGGGGGFLKIWDTSNVFGGPSLIGQIRKELLASPSSSSSTPPPSKTAAAEKAPTPPSSTTAESKPSPLAAAVAEVKEEVEEEAPVLEAAATDESSGKKAEMAAAAVAVAETLPVEDDDTSIDEAAVPSRPVVVKNEKENKTNSGGALKMPPEDAQGEDISLKNQVHTKPPPPEAALLKEGGEHVDDSSFSKPTAVAATEVHTASSSSPSASSSPPHDETTTTTAPLFDFPTTTGGVAATEEKAVNPKEFLEPCRAIATLQIARDLRSDGAVQLSSLLSGLPTDVRKACAASAEHDGDNDESFEISEEQAREFSIQVHGDGIVDLDLEEELRNVRTFREIVQRQGEARQKLYTLLTKSNCNFGADEAAAAMYQADKARRVELRKRKRILADAMELEGLDVPEEKSKTTQVQEKLVPLPWYTPPPDDNDNDNVVAESS
jgi:hypothetical protein